MNGLTKALIKTGGSAASLQYLLLFDNIVSLYLGKSFVSCTIDGSMGLVASPRSLNYVSVVFYGHPGSSVSVTAPLIGHRHSG